MSPEPAPPPTLVFLHHFGGSARTWDGVVGRLRAEYDCVAPDLRGFGTASGQGGPFSVAQYADDAADLARRLGLERYVLVGHSMGGKIALAWAARRPMGLVSLVLLAPSPPNPEPMSEEDRAEMLAGYGDRQAALATIAKITARQLQRGVAERTADDMLRSSKAAWTAWLEVGSREDISAKVEGVATPVLVAAGEEDRAIPADVQITETVPRLRDARLVTLPETGHLLPLEAEAVVADLIRREATAASGTSRTHGGGAP